jgi:hypothetical protein
MTTFLLVLAALWIWHSIGSEVVRIKYPDVFADSDKGFEEFKMHHLKIFLILGPVSWVQLIFLRFS